MAAVKGLLKHRNAWNGQYIEVGKRGNKISTEVVILLNEGFLLDLEAFTFPAFHCKI